MKKAIIIGSGLGGLAVAIRLQSRGISTTIYEKNAMAGGHAYQFKEKGYTFDMGPSLITEIPIIERLFKQKDFSLTAKKLMQFKIAEHCTLHKIEYKKLKEIENKLQLSSAKLLADNLKNS